MSRVPCSSSLKNNSQQNAKVVSNFFTDAKPQLNDSADFQKPKLNCKGPKAITKTNSKAIKTKPKKSKGQKDIRQALKSKKNDLISYTEDFNKICAKSGIDIDSEQLQLAIALSKSVQDQENTGNSSQNSGNSSQNSETSSIQERTGKIRSTLLEYGFKVPEIKVDVQTKRKRKLRRPSKLLQVTAEEREQIITNRFSQILLSQISEKNTYLNELNSSECSKNNLYGKATNVTYKDILEDDFFYVKKVLKPASNTVGTLLRDWSKIPGRDLSPPPEERKVHDFKKVIDFDKELDILLSGHIRCVEKLMHDKDFVKDELSFVKQKDELLSTEEGHESCLDELIFSPRVTYFIPDIHTSVTEKDSLKDEENKFHFKLLINTHAHRNGLDILKTAQQELLPEPDFLKTEEAAESVLPQVNHTDQNTFKETNMLENGSTIENNHTKRNIIREFSPDLFDDETSIVNSQNTDLSKSILNTPKNSMRNKLSKTPEKNTQMNSPEIRLTKLPDTIALSNSLEEINDVDVNLRQPQKCSEKHIKNLDCLTKSSVTCNKSNDFMDLTECVTANKTFLIQKHSPEKTILENHIDLTQYPCDSIQETLIEGRNFVTNISKSTIYKNEAHCSGEDQPVNTIDLTQSSDSNESLPVIDNLGGNAYQNNNVVQAEMNPTQSSSKEINIQMNTGINHKTFDDFIYHHSDSASTHKTSGNSFQSIDNVIHRASRSPDKTKMSHVAESEAFIKYNLIESPKKTVNNSLVLKENQIDINRIIRQSNSLTQGYNDANDNIDLTQSSNDSESSIKQQNISQKIENKLLPNSPVKTDEIENDVFSGSEIIFNNDNEHVVLNSPEHVKITNESIISIIYEDIETIPTISSPKNVSNVYDDIDGKVSLHNNISEKNCSLSENIPSSQCSEYFEISDEELEYSMMKSKLNDSFSEDNSFQNVDPPDYDIGNISILDDIPLDFTSGENRSEGSMNKNPESIFTTRSRGSVSPEIKAGRIIKKCSSRSLSQSPKRLISPVKFDSFVNIKEKSTGNLPNSPENVYKGNSKSPVLLSKSQNNSEEVLTRDTPTSKDYIVKTMNVTPMADFSSLSTPERNNELGRYGIKPFKRKRAIQLLEHLYYQTHPIIENCTEIETLASPSKRRKHELQESQVKIQEFCASIKSLSPKKSIKNQHSQKSPKKKITQVKNISEKITNSPSKSDKIINNLVSLTEIGDNDRVFEVTNENPTIRDLYSSCEDLVFQKREKAKVHGCKVPLHIAFHNYVSCRTFLKEAILKYEPINIGRIHKDLVSYGHRYDPKDLLRFLDKKCITVKTADNGNRQTKKQTNS